MTTVLPNKVYFRPDEVANYFSVSLRTIYYWCDMGIIESIKISGSVRIHRGKIKEFEQNSNRFGTLSTVI